MTEEELQKLIAQVIYSHPSYRGTEEDHIEWVKRDLKNGKEIYSMTDIMRCLKALDHYYATRTNS